MIVTYNIVADFTTWQYRSVDLPQQYRCTAVSWFGKWSVTQVYKVFGHTTWWWADRPWRAIARAAAVQEQERRDWRKGIVADSDDEQDAAEPANGPWNSVTISRHCREISHDIAIQKIPTIRALYMRWNYVGLYIQYVMQTLKLSQSWPYDERIPNQKYVKKYSVLTKLDSCYIFK